MHAVPTGHATPAAALGAGRLVLLTTATMMLLPLFAMAAACIAPQGPLVAGVTGVAAPETLAVAAFTPDSSATFVVRDTVRRRPRAVEVSDAYATRLRIHRYASYTMIPLFAIQSVAGNQLYQADRTGAEKPGWAKATHAAGATGIAALFTVNTVTGVWNLWESRGNETGRTKRWVHSILLLASDAGFAYSGISAGEAEESQATRNRHRNVSYAAMASALAGYAVMLVGEH